mmetsp:Transcript_126439/g.369435  ORF Transcript_126439/g.369435 Transcript_126439/m.369435 type:complete len:221 (-) Transcript_126439:140-802(-)
MHARCHVLGSEGLRHLESHRPLEGVCPSLLEKLHLRDDLGHHLHGLRGAGRDVELAVELLHLRQLGGLARLPGLREEVRVAAAAVVAREVAHEDPVAHPGVALLPQLVVVEELQLQARGPVHLVQPLAHVVLHALLQGAQARLLVQLGAAEEVGEDVVLLTLGLTAAAACPAVRAAGPRGVARPRAPCGARSSTSVAVGLQHAAGGHATHVAGADLAAGV